jgi:hypothetical protein
MDMHSKLSFGWRFFSTLGFSQATLSATPDIEVPDGKAMIYFFRTGFGGGAIQFHVHNMAGNPMGYLGKNGDNFSIVVDPGTHQYWSRAARRNDVSLTVEAGNIYYVKGSVNFGFAVGRPVLEQVSAADVP